MNNIRSDGKPAHVWITGKEAGFHIQSKLYMLYMCKNCGVLKGNAKYPETPCRGRVNVTTRS